MDPKNHGLEQDFVIEDVVTRCNQYFFNITTDGGHGEANPYKYDPNMQELLFVRVYIYMYIAYV